MSTQARLQPDRADLTRFIGGLFRYADADTFAALRGFDQVSRRGPARLVEGVRITADLSDLVDRATRAAERCADTEEPAVFAPPICTFSNTTRARGEDLANGLALSVELDEGDSGAARRKLEGMLGPATVVVASGGEWVHPDTGEVFPKLHMHWRLSEPTREADDHDKLRQARDMACNLVGADPTGKPVVHPLRWPGSWNLKGKPRIAAIVAFDENREINLVDALDALSDAIEAEGIQAADLPAQSDDPTAPLPRLASAMATIPNADVHYDQWIKYGYAVFRASGGSADGYGIWDAWSQMSEKYDAGEQEAAWKRICAAVTGSKAPRTIGAGTIFFDAARYGWEPPRPVHDLPEEPEGYWDTIDGGPIEPEAEPAAVQEGGDRPVLDPRSPMNSASVFIHHRYSEGGLRTLLHQNGTFYGWRRSHYVEVAFDEMRADIYHFLDKALRLERKVTVAFDPNKTKVANVLEATAAGAQIRSGLRPPSWIGTGNQTPAAEMIACANGLLHLPTRDMIAHTPAFFTLNALDFAYAPKAPSPSAWKAFLATLFLDDQQSIDTLQEIFGLCLTGDTRHQKAFLMVGPKRSGKGTIARVLTQLLGQANVVGPTLSSLAQNFGLAPLIGKRLAIISDARLGGKVDQSIITERILSITGEDSLTVDRKFRDGWTGKLETRFLILSNELPRLSDASGALAGRFILLRLVRSFYGNEDLSLTAKLLAELPGILNWAIDGWDRLTRRGYFIPPASSEAAMRELEDLGSPIGAFLRDRCVVAPERSEAADNLYREWCDWCSEQRRDHPGIVQTFGRDLSAAVPGLTITNNRVNGNMRQRRYSGIGIKTDSDRQHEEG